MGSESIGLDSKAMMARGIIALVKSNQLVKNIETKQLQLAKRDSAAIVLVFKPAAFRYQWAITYSLVVACLTHIFELHVFIFFFFQFHLPFCYFELFLTPLKHSTSLSAMFAYIGVPPNNLINACAPSLGPRLSLFSEVSYNQQDKLMGGGVVFAIWFQR